ncbi:MAG TPA: hypothetical protein VJU58_05975 [Microbacterium sp.]|nr:hypothetical protein [Microbacterium sp.]
MDEAMPHDRLTAAGAVTLVSAAGAVLSLWFYNSLWVQKAGIPAALDAYEGAAVFAWLVGWLLVTCAAGAAIVLLGVVIRRIIAGRLPLTDLVALAAGTALIVGAISLAPLWATAASV